MKADVKPNVGNRKYIVEKGTTPQIICCTADHRFIILPFTSGSSEAVYCVPIFQHKGEEVPMTRKTRIDSIIKNPICNEKGEIELDLLVRVNTSKDDQSVTLDGKKWTVSLLHLKVVEELIPPL